MMSVRTSRFKSTPLAGGFAAAAKTIRWLALLLLGLFVVSGVTVVEPGDVALVLRLGQLTGTTAADQVHQPGLLLALPYPIDEVVRIPVKREGEVEINDVWQALDGSAGGDVINPLREGYVLTGDQNLLQTRLTVKYRIVDPLACYLQSSEPEAILRNIVVSALSNVASSLSVDELLRQQRVESENTAIGAGATLSQETLRLAQARMDRLGTGLTLSALEFKELHPPRHVVEEFRKVQSAKIAIETLKREAEGYASREIPKAQAERNRLVADAETFANALTANARAEMSVFAQVLEQYQATPSLVKQRLYQETLEGLFSQIGRVEYVPPGTRLLLPAEGNSPARIEP